MTAARKLKTPRPSPVRLIGAPRTPPPPPREPEETLPEPPDEPEPPTTGGLFGVSVRALAAVRVVGAVASMSRHLRHWTTDEDAALRSAWALGGSDAAARATGRSPYACAARALRLRLPRPVPDVGLVSGHELARRLGCKRPRVMRAARILGVRTVARAPTQHGRKRAGLERMRFFTARGAEAIVRYLTGDAPDRFDARSDGAWGEGRKPWGCLRCLSNDRPHKSCGLCTRCSITCRLLGRGPSPGAGAGVVGPPDLGPHAAAAADVVEALAGRRVPLAARHVANRSGRFREQVRDALRALVAARVVTTLRDKNGHKRYALAIDRGEWWWAR